MIGRAWIAAVVLILSCEKALPTTPPACEPISAFEPGLGDEIVWGYADLHAHPGIEEAFERALIWGSAIDDAPINGNELPRIKACPVETHVQPAQGSIDRAVGQVVFPAVAEIAKFAHAPVATGGHRSTNAWPNARDVIHQQMNVASIRRAYEGGLRLMFASTTDDQVIAALLTGPNVVDGFVPKRSADYDSAVRQLDFINKIVAANHSWMGIARTPAEARRLIRAGNLALVLSSEMNGLDHQAGDLERLVREHGVRHVFPIHLIDNDIGGTAANASLFNSASAAVSELYRSDGKRMQYMDLTATKDFAHPFGLPKTLATADVPVYVGLEDLPYVGYDALCYEPLSACQGTVAEPRTSFIQFGQQNLRGLCTTAEECEAGSLPGAARILAMMDAGLLIDISHMGALSVEQTVALDAGFPFPLIASHGDIGHLCKGFDGGCEDSSLEAPTERSLEGDMAREIVRRNGVLGLGTGLGAYDSRAVLSARGVPLLLLDPAGATAGCAATPADGCEPTARVDVTDAGLAIETLQVTTLGGISGYEGNAQPFVKVELRDPSARDHFQRRVVLTPMRCSNDACSASVELGRKEELTLESRRSCEPQLSESGSALYTVDDLESVTLQWLYLKCDLECQRAVGPKIADRQCTNTWNDPRAPRWPMTQITLTAGAQQATVASLATFGPRLPLPVVTLDLNRGTFPIYARDERPSIRADVPATGRLLKVSVTSGMSGTSLLGSSAQQVGANVCVAVRQKAGGACPATPPPPPGATECPVNDGWVPINQRGEWKEALLLYAFVRIAGDESTVCGVDVTILDWDRASFPFAIDSIRVDAIEDPVGHWVRRYVEISRYVTGGRMGAIAMGTDFNGLNGVTDISEYPVPPGAVASSFCPVTPHGAAQPPPPPMDANPSRSAALPLTPMRFRNADGTLGEQVLIEERGLGTYGLLADFVAIVRNYPECGKDVHDSLMLSAEATLRAWEAIVEPGAHPNRAPLPTRPFSCDLGSSR